MEKNPPQTMNNNVNIAIMNKVNELASRYGIEPYEMITSLRYETRFDSEIGGHDMTGRSILTFESRPSEPSKFERYELMLETIGASLETGKLAGEDEELFKALDKGLATAPRSRSR